MGPGFKGSEFKGLGLKGSRAEGFRVQGFGVEGFKGLRVQSFGWSHESKVCALLFRCRVRGSEQQDARLSHSAAHFQKQPCRNATAISIVAVATERTISCITLQPSHKSTYRLDDRS